MRTKRISGALIVSLVIHCLIMLVGSTIYITQTVQFKDALVVEFLSSQETPRPQVRRSLFKRVVKPTIPKDRSFLLEQGQVQPRVTTHAAVRPAPSVQPQTVLEFSNKVAKLDAPINPNVPKAVSPMVPAPSTTPASTGGSVQVKASFERPAGLAMVQHVGAARDALGNVKVPPLNPPNDEAYHDMYFKGSGTNPFIDTEDDHLSTFGMDVDTGSYSITRRYLTDGYLPPPEAVRVEEFINAFDYNYDPPTDSAFAIHIDGAPSNFGEGKRLQLLRIGLQGRVIPAEHRKDAILTFVIDVSRLNGKRKSPRVGKEGTNSTR